MHEDQNSNSPGESTNISSTLDGINLPKIISGNLKKTITSFFGRTFYLLDSASQKISDNKAREILSTGIANNIIGKIDSGDPIVDAIFNHEVNRIFRNKINIQEITNMAIEQLPEKSRDDENDTPEISEDWLNIFRKKVEDFSSDDMKAGFSKILAGEIQSPGTFSPRLLDCFANLDRHTATIFRNYCDCAMSHPLFEPRVCTMDKHDNDPEMKAMGITYSNSVHLQEYGLLSPNLRSYQEFSKLNFHFMVSIGNKRFSDPTRKISEANEMIKLNGLAFSSIGRQLFKIIDKNYNEKYFDLFSHWLSKTHSVHLIPSG